MSTAPRAALGLSGLGVALSGYLSYEHATGSRQLACPATGVVDCLRVTTSPQSVVLGVPVAVWGLLFFIGMAALTLPAAWRRSGLRHLRTVGAVSGAVTVLYLVHVELTQSALCLWCTGVHVTAVALMLAVLLADPVARDVHPPATARAPEEVRLPACASPVATSSRAASPPAPPC